MIVAHVNNSRYTFVTVQAHLLGCVNNCCCVGCNIGLIWVFDGHPAVVHAQKAFEKDIAYSGMSSQLSAK